MTPVNRQCAMPAEEVVNALAAKRRFRPYPEYRDSGVEWLGETPSRWKVRKLKHIASLRTSNVDKKSHEEEQPVRLCNYTDVYYNEQIVADLTFMEATAGPEEIDKFSLMKGDVLITKDSEDPNDIAVPACVADDLDGILCGYHLAQVRSNPSLAHGPYLARAFKASGIRDQFNSQATGITRHGLSKDTIGSSLFFIPPLDEQRAIAAFLDRETGRIDEVIARQQRLIELLAEKRTALISHAVTQGLNPDAPMKDSGIEWLRRIPEDWDVCRLKTALCFLNNMRVPISGEDRAAMAKEYPYYGASGIIDYVEDYIFDEPLILVAEDGANLYSRSTPLAFIARGQYWVNNHAHILRPNEGPISFWEAVLQTVEYDPWITGSAQPKLTKENLGDVPLPLPPLDEQQAITEFLHRETARIDELVTKVNEAIDRLREYRSALISAAVTGKIDVRGAVTT